MSTLRLTTLSNQGGTASVPSDTVINGTAKAWVNFNGTGTVAIRRAFNVSSITDNGTGDYTINFTTPMVDTDYATFCGGITGDADNSTGRFLLGVRGTSTTITSSVRVISVWTGDGTTLGDKIITTVAVFR
jgi:hypothetical protein